MNISLTPEQAETVSGRGRRVAPSPWLKPRGRDSQDDPYPFANRKVCRIRPL